MMSCSILRSNLRLEFIRERSSRRRCSLTLCYFDTAPCSWPGFLSKGHVVSRKSPAGLSTVTHFFTTLWEGATCQHSRNMVFIKNILSAKWFSEKLLLICSDWDVIEAVWLGDYLCGLQGFQHVVKLEELHGHKVHGTRSAHRITALLHNCSRVTWCCEWSEQTVTLSGVESDRVLLFH